MTTSGLIHLHNGTGCGHQNPVHQRFHQNAGNCRVQSCTHGDGVTRQEGLREEPAEGAPPGHGMMNERAFFSLFNSLYLVSFGQKGLTHILSPVKRAHLRSLPECCRQLWFDCAPLGHTHHTENPRLLSKHAFSTPCTWWVP